MNDRIKSIEAQLASLAEEVKPIAQKSATAELTADESKRFDELIEQINKGKTDLGEAKDRHAKAQSVLEMDKHLNQPADNVKREGVGVNAGPATQSEYKSPGRSLVDSEAYKNAIKNGSGVTKYSPVEFPGFFGPDSQKAVIGSATASASALLAQVMPGIYRGMERPLVMRDVLMNLSTNSDSLTVMQEGTFTNAAAEVAEATSVATGLKPEAAITFTEATFPVQTIAHWLPVTRQLLEDLAFMGSYIDERLLTGLKRREDAAFLNGTGVAPILRGILQTSGIQVLDAAYFTGAPVKNAATDNENLNRIRRAIRVIQVTGQATPTFVVMNPANAETVDTSTDANRQYVFGGPTAPLPRTLWGLPIVESDNIAVNTALVGDGTMAAVVDRHQARIYTTDSHSDFFVRNLFVVLAEERVALPVFRPAAFASVTLIA